MKKSTFFLACCIGLMFFASCKKDPIAPTINIYAGEGCVTENAQLYSGDEIMVGFQVTGEKLTNIEVLISQNGIQLASDSESIDAEVYTYLNKFTIDATGIVNIKGTITDAAGQTATKSFNIVYEEKPNAKFLGEYQGNVLFNGTMEASVAGMDPIQQEVTDNETPVILSITEGETVDEVVEALGMHLCQLHGVDDADGLFQVVGRIRLLLLLAAEVIVGLNKLVDRLIVFEVHRK